MSDVFGLWFGGSSYAASTDMDMEQFESIDDAGGRLEDRYRNGYWQAQQFDFVRKAPERSLTPVVDESSYIDLYLHPDSLVPFLRLELNQKGEVTRSDSPERSND